MAYCGPRGIPHSVFLGGPAGWTQDDRDKALAWQELQRQTCHACGTRAEEWDPDQGGDRGAYTFEIAVCPGCEQAERTESAMATDEWKSQRGKKIRARRRATST
jgi:hypothetical protein